MAGKYHFSRDVVFNENTPGHLSPHCGLSMNHALLPPSSVISNPFPTHDQQCNLNIPHLTPTKISLPDPLGLQLTHFQNLLNTTMTNLSISLNTAYDITPPPSPDLHTHYSSLFHEFFLSAPPSFLCNCSWNLSKPPNSYHEAVTHLDNAAWLDAMQ